MERWLAYLRDLLPGILNALDSFNERVIRYPLLAFYSSTTFGMLFLLLWIRGSWDRWRLRRHLAALWR